jgi:hypothetical protein
MHSYAIHINLYVLLQCSGQSFEILIRVSIRFQVITFLGLCAFDRRGGKL